MYSAIPNVIGHATSSYPTVFRFHGRRANPGHVAAPFAGVVTLAVESGATVEQGATVATIEAMKMEASITAPRAGTVARTAIGPVQQVEGGDLLLVLE